MQIKDSVIRFLQGIFFALFLFLDEAVCFAQDTTVPSDVVFAIPAFEERFEWSTFPGGNDGKDFIGYNQVNPNTNIEKYNYYLLGNSCVRLGTSTSTGSFLLYDLENVVKGGFVTFRVLPLDGKMTLETNYLILKNGEYSYYKQTRTLNSARMTNVRYSGLEFGKADNEWYLKIEGVEEGDADSKIYRKFILDDFMLYSRSTSYEELCNAGRLIVYKSSALTSNEIDFLKRLAAANPKLASIDLYNAKYNGSFDLSPANPNCIIYDSNNIVNDAPNVVRVEDSFKDATRDEKINNYFCDNLQITDGYPFDPIYDFMAKNVTYSRTFKGSGSGYYSTMCLPFALANKPEGISAVYGFTSYDKNRGLAYFDEKISMDAFTPYIVVPAEKEFKVSLQNVLIQGTTPMSVWSGQASGTNESTDYLFGGTLIGKSNVKSTDSQVFYGFQGGKFVRVGASDESAVKFGPFRSYLTINGSGVAGAAPAITLSGDIMGINNPKISDEGQTPDAVYTISGEKVGDGKVFKEVKADLPRGIYVVGGKKVLVK